MGAMSWSDDIRCLYCDGRLPLYRKITNGQFCSAAHRKAYWQEQERLAVERLHQTHDSLRAYRPAGGIQPTQVEAILGKLPLQPEPEIAAVTADNRPWWMPLVNRAEVPMAAFVTVPRLADPRWPADGIALGNLGPLTTAGVIRRPFNLFQPFDGEFLFAGTLGLEPGTAKAGNAANITDLVPMNVVLYPVARLISSIQPIFDRIEAAEEETPPVAGLRMLSRPGALQLARRIAQTEPLALAIRAQLPLDELILHAALAPAALFHAGLRALPVDRVALVQGPWIDGLRWLDFRAQWEVPGFSVAISAPRLGLAAGRQYPLVSQPASSEPLRLAAAVITTPNPPAPSLPSHLVRVIRGKSPARAEQTSPMMPEPMQEPSPAGLVGMASLGQPRPPVNEIRPAPAALSSPQTPRPQPLRPPSKLEPLNPRPAFDLTAAYPPPPAEEQPKTPVQQFSAVGPHTHAVHALKVTVDFWKRAPRDLKMLMFAIPLMLGLALHPALPKVRVAAPAQAAAIQRDVQKAWNEQWVNVKQTVADRAAVALDEDFRSGLDDWMSRGDATTEWSFDATGFVRPGPLALYRPSMSLTDYQAQFLGIIDKKALSWVIRAADFSNFYVVKLEVLKGGPLPTIGVTRYAVVNGKADSRVDTIAAINARADMLYRVLMDVHGDEFALTIQGQLVDAWSEPRLRHGGIGFFTARGEESRVRWVQVTHQYDMLGRLCAYLAPYNIQNSSVSGGGSWQ